MIIIVSQRYSYLGCGPRVHCTVCGKVATSEVKDAGPATFGGPPAEWSLHCGSCRRFLSTTVFKVLENPFFRNLTEKNRQQYNTNRKEVLLWLRLGWPETQEKLLKGSLIGGGRRANERHLAYLKRQFPELLDEAASPPSGSVP